MRMGAQTEKFKEGGLGCANRVRKQGAQRVSRGGGGRVRKGAHYGIVFFASSSSFLKESLINGY